MADLQMKLCLRYVSLHKSRAFARQEVDCAQKWQADVIGLQFFFDF